MNLHALLRQRDANDNPVRVGVIGCGKFASMYLAQAIRTPGMHVVAIADLDPANARENLKRIEWPEERYEARDFDDARRTDGTWITDDVAAVFENTTIEVVIDATGDPAAGVRHALMACEAGKSIVMVNVEADVLAGPLLAKKARESGIVYSLAYGDQPALICDLVDWARAAGFDVVAAGRGHKWKPEFRYYTPDNVWDGYGLSAEKAALGGMNPKMFTSFLDGTKPAIESTAVANVTGLTPAPLGLAFPPGRIDEIPNLCRPVAEGGVLDHKGQVEVISSLDAAGELIDYNIRYGVFVAFEAANDYVARCFSEYGLATDDSGRYAVMYKRWHLIGLELGVSVASAGIRREPTGSATGWRADAVAMAKRDLAVGDMLDGEGGYTVSAKLLPAAASLADGALPIGLAHNVKVIRPVAKDQTVTWADVQVDNTDIAVRTRREMERTFGPQLAEAAE